jgi:antitoxin MazE
MNATVQKWGNSLALRIPSSLGKDLKLVQGSLVELSLQGGDLVVTPRKTTHASLAQLLNGITDKNRHSATDWDGAVGREFW